MIFFLKTAVVGAVVFLTACGPESNQAVPPRASSPQEAQRDGPQIPSLPALSPEAAVAGFDSTRIDHSLARLALSLTQNPIGTRAAALAHLTENDQAIRFAVLVALAATAEPGESLDALRPFLDSENSGERLLAASRLASWGERSALPLLIEGLGSDLTLPHSTPPEPAWRLSRRTLLMHTAGDFGLREADDVTSVKATQEAWQAWWNENASTLYWNARARRFTAEDPWDSRG
jgi:hypothetical protein